MREMVERVARAIYAKSETYPDYALAGMNGHLATDYAVAAIEAMREPTEAMLAVEVPGYPDDDDPPRTDLLWQAMITAALQGESG